MKQLIQLENIMLLLFTLFIYFYFFNFSWQLLLLLLLVPDISMIGYMVDTIKTSSVNWRFVLRLKASFSGLSLKGSPNSFPYAPHLLTNPKRIIY